MRTEIITKRGLIKTIFFILGVILVFISLINFAEYPASSFFVFFAGTMAIVKGK